jgi:hypothetical protein
VSRRQAAAQGFKRLVDYLDVPLPNGQPARPRQARGRVRLPALAILALLLVAGPVGLAFSRTSRAQPTVTLADVARQAGCQLHEYQRGRTTNPPVTGRLVEREFVPDGSHIGQLPPSVAATTHSLLHGRVLIQYRPGLPPEQIRALDRFVKRDPDYVVGFANQTGMPAPVAATAYLSLLTCPRVSAGSLGALAAFRERRKAFGNAF